MALSGKIVARGGVMNNEAGKIAVTVVNGDERTRVIRVRSEIELCG